VKDVSPFTVTVPPWRVADALPWTAATDNVAVARYNVHRGSTPGFTPSAGKVTVFHQPGGTGVRVDTAAYAEGVIPPYYDSLIAKLITHGKDREEAMARMQRALDMFVVEGIFTTIPLHKKILADADFRAGKYDTKFMERFLAKKEDKKAAIKEVLSA